MFYKHKTGLHVRSYFSEDGLFRYRLDVEKRHETEGLTLCVIMQNPSEANDMRADKSIQFLENLIFEKDYEAFRNVQKMVVVNQFAYVQKHGFEGRIEQIGEKNDEVISKSIQDSDIILIAWGKQNQYQDRKEFVYSILGRLEGKSVFETKKHPSRGFYKDFIKPVNLVDLQS